jgi:hypothetical protein
MNYTSYVRGAGEPRLGEGSGPPVESLTPPSARSIAPVQRLSPDWPSFQIYTHLVPLSGVAIESLGALFPSSPRSIGSSRGGESQTAADIVVYTSQAEERRDSAAWWLEMAVPSLAARLALWLSSLCPWIECWRALPTWGVDDALDSRCPGPLCQRAPIPLVAQIVSDTARVRAAEVVRSQTLAACGGG